MDIWQQLLFWLHMIGLALGGVVSFGMPVLGAQMGSAPPEARPAIAKVMERFTTFGRAALVLLLVTGILLFWLAYDFTAPSMTWFGIKMVLVVILIVLVVFAGVNGKRAQGGDVSAAKRAPILGMASLATFILILLSATLAFK